MEVLDNIEHKAPTDVRMVSFNINGFRTLFHYHPWSKLRSLSGVFQSMKADIITLQELKLTAKDIDNSVGKVEGYHSFITVPSVKRGYSGVGVYIRIPKDDEPNSVKNSLKVVKAEEGITGTLISRDTKKPYLDSENAIGGYPNIELDMATKIDSEGRCIVLEFANNVVVISVYCPANSMGTEEGESFRVQFIDLLFSRIRNLHQLGKHVVLMGDINISRDLIDSAEGLNQYRKDGLIKEVEDTTKFEITNKSSALKFIRSTLPRIMLNELLIDSLDNEAESDRILIDTTRKIQGRRLGMYTVWNTIRNSRPGNYGSRIDLILSTSVLGSYVTNSNIWPFLMGSDHCPIFTDFQTGSFDKEFINFPLPKLEAKYAYKLSSGSIDMMFAMAKRKTPPSSDPTPTSSQTKSKSDPVVKKQKVVKTQGSISNFFVPKETKKQPSTVPFSQSSSESISKPTSESTSESTSSSQPQSQSQSKSLKISNGRFLIPTENIPNCKHDEPCILKTARTAENKGKKFWSCAKSAGTITTDEDKQKFSCNFFQWK